MMRRARTPLIAALPKMFFPFLVILPGLIAYRDLAHGRPDPIGTALAAGARRTLPEGRHGIDPGEDG